ncbi:c1c74cc1-913f-4505-b64d-bfc8e105fdce [Sclerotinia trifoliorum]|uniref:C1c74cc1-913f-4505-b64d-bfc8e105fdce n=1 Tax=Sclerotinia trifoliorum TaxID=28548 RepID=A0A8H2ZTP6_9HELO|nr:c1c74cc1-913f-4505-b64d-bfc8e105fdce [Sclerotinia trifoliorum]
MHPITFENTGGSLSNEKRYGDDNENCPHCRNQSLKSISYRRLQSWAVLIMMCGMVAAFTLIGMASLLTSSRSNFTKLPEVTRNNRPSLWTPFADGIQYEIETASPDLWANDIYMGEPCDESERAWNRLIHPNRGHGVRLYREEAARLDINKSILLPDNNFAVILTVHHNLHCLRRLRQSFFPEHYYANWTDEDRADDRHHALHCLESLRSSMICQPDLAPLPYYWSGNIRHDMNASPQSKRECVNWDVFSEYLKGRSYHRSEMIHD